MQKIIFIGNLSNEKQNAPFTTLCWFGQSEKQKPPYCIFLFSLHADD